MRQKALRLEYALISYNLLEGIIAIAAGWLAILRDENRVICQHFLEELGVRAQLS